MRWKTLLPIFLIFSIYLAGVAIADTITGRLTSQPTNISVAVISSVPILSIHSPLNGTYLLNESLFLNYSARYANTVWYNIDNGTNYTLTGPVYFNTSEGPHILYLYANNSDNDITNASAAFYTNNTLLILIYDEEKGATKGNSTDFIRFTLEQLQNLSNVILENTLYGKIAFQELINVTDDPDPTDNFVNLDLYTNLSYNRIEINASADALDNFNKSAVINMYGLNLTNPRVLRNDEICPASICTTISYIGGVFTFSVTGFTVYSTEETPPEEVVPPTGRGPRAPAAELNLEFDKEEISVSLVPGESKIETLTVTNPLTRNVPLEISYPDLVDFLEIEEKEFVLGVGESNELNLEFKAKEDAEPGLYMGYIIFTSGSLEARVLVAVEIESVEKLVDIEIEVPAVSMIKIAKEKLIVHPGESIFFDVNLINLEELGKAEVLVEYFIKDPYNNVLVYENETIIVQDSISFIKELPIPKAYPGQYLLYVKSTYKERVSSDSVFFQIERRVSLWVYLIILIVIILIIWFVRKQRHKYAEEGLSGWKR